MKKRNKFFLIGGILILVLISFWVTKNILIPANVSYNLACGSQEEVDVLLESYVISGSVTFNNSIIEGELINNIEVEIFDEDENTIKHELVHISQIERGFPSLFCSTPYQKYFSEVEAYFGEYIPNPIYNLIYWKPKI